MVGLGHCKLFKAGHHGSAKATNNKLLDNITPDIVVITCVAGSTEYTSVQLSTFPTQSVISRLAARNITDVYVTSQSTDTDPFFASLNGNVVIIVDDDGAKVQCSNNNTILKTAHGSVQTIEHGQRNSERVARPAGLEPAAARSVVIFSTYGHLQEH